MISRQMILRSPFFSDFNSEQIDTLTKAAEEFYAEAGHSFFLAGEELKKFYFVLEGDVHIVIGVPDRTKKQNLVDHIYSNFTAKDLTVCSVGAGEMFGWSALIPPHKSTAGAVAASNMRVLSFDCHELRLVFENDAKFAYLMTLKAAQAIRERLRCIQIESLAFVHAVPSEAYQA